MPAKGSKYAFVPEDPKRNKAKIRSIERREKFGVGTVEDRLRNPEYYHHLGNPEQIPYDDYNGVWGDNSVSKNMDVARPKKAHTNADQKTSAYVPRPGDNMPQAWHNHAQIKKPTLVMRFKKVTYQEWEKRTTWRVAYKWYERSQNTAWRIYEKWGANPIFRCEVWRKGKLVHKSYGANPKDTVLQILGRAWYFAKDAAMNLPLWTPPKVTVSEKVPTDDKGLGFVLKTYDVYRVSVYKAVHILLGENPKTPLPQKHVTESFSDSHLYGHFFWNVIERPTPKPKSLYHKGVSTGASSDAHEPQMI